MLLNLEHWSCLGGGGVLALDELGAAVAADTGPGAVVHGTVEAVAAASVGGDLVGGLLFGFLRFDEFLLLLINSKEILLEEVETDNAHVSHIE